MFRDARQLPASAGIGGARRAAMSVARATLAASLMLFAGCMYKGAKITEGTDFSAGVSFPGAEGAAELSFVNYLSGFRLGADRNCGVKCEFWGTNTFSFAWGLYESLAVKHFKATVKPCETNAPTSQATILREALKVGCGKQGCKCLNCPCAPESCPCEDKGGIGQCGCPFML